MRITEKTLVGLATTLNQMTYRPTSAWHRLEKPDAENRQMHAQIGCIHVASEQGIYAIYEMQRIGGAVSRLFSGRAAECYAYLQGRIDGLSDKRLPLAFVRMAEQASPSELTEMRETLEGFADRTGAHLLKGRIANLVATLFYKVRK